MASNKASGESSRKAFLMELRQRIIRISVAVIAIISICMTMSITTFDFGDYKMLMLYPDMYHSVSSQIISFMKDTLLPKNVSLIQISTGQAFYAQIYVALVTGVIITLPLVFAEVFAFISPALKHHEKKVIKNILLPSIFLFLAGCFFSYYIVIPYTIEFLYKYGVSMTVTSFFDVSLFISFVMHMLMIFGFSYQLPLIMWALTKTKFVESRFWKKNFRYIMIILVMIGAIITPDGSGVSMWFVTGPLIFLYVIGLLLIELKLNKKG